MKDRIKDALGILGFFFIAFICGPLGWAIGGILAIYCLCWGLEILFEKKSAKS